MFLNDSNRAKFLALLLVFGLNNNCGAMESISGKDTVDDSQINYSNSNGNVSDQNKKCIKLWKKLFENVCKKFGHSMLTYRIWDKMLEISRSENAYDISSCIRIIDNLLISSRDYKFHVKNFKGEHLSGRSENGTHLNIFELILNDQFIFMSPSRFVQKFTNMFKDETAKMRQKSPQELLDEYWIPEFGTRDFHGHEQPEQISSCDENKIYLIPESDIHHFHIRKQNECNIPEGISSCEISGHWDCDPPSSLAKSILAAYALPDRDSWRASEIIFEPDLYSEDLYCAIRNFASVVKDKKIDKIVFEPGIPLRYYSGTEVKNLDLENTENYNTSSLFKHIIDKSDRASYFLTGHDKCYLVNFGILLISRVLESFINQAVVLSGLSDQMFDRIEITKFGYDPAFKIFEGDKEIELSTELYKKVYQKLKNIYILSSI